ncbi:hypothetical protein MKEN_01237600 [Mycena kentingensis (nom. inval.)]|nr:hypothetical protein MKEN_01237600 [Mycena kentingensis (nom. inval.)]
MDALTPPPQYTSERSNADAPAGTTPPLQLQVPEYSLPTSFTIGAQTTHPFVQVSQLKNHLALLHAFAELKLKVEALAPSPDMSILHLPENKERRWTVFVGMAVERFERWCKALPPTTKYDKGIATILPPIDVIMVWHAYLLNPGWYAEDLARVDGLGGLARVSEGFGNSLSDELGDIACKPSPERIDNWTRTTGTPFDPFESLTHLVTKELACPKCRAIVYAPSMTEVGDGYLQAGFSFACEACGFEITRDTLALRKFVTDLSASDAGKVQDVMAETLLPRLANSG